MCHLHPSRESPVDTNMNPSNLCFVGDIVMFLHSVFTVFTHLNAKHLIFEIMLAEVVDVVDILGRNH